MVLQKSKSEKPARRAESQAGQGASNRHPQLKQSRSPESTLTLLNRLFESLGHFDSRKGRKPDTSTRLTAGDNGGRATKTLNVERGLNAPHGGWLNARTDSTTTLARAEVATPITLNAERG